MNMVHSGLKDSVPTAQDETMTTNVRVVAYIDRALRDCLPPGIPPSYTAIECARWDGRGRARKAVGQLRMFDGQPATVEVFEAGVCTGHRYTEMPGGNAYYEGGRWLRDVPARPAGTERSGVNQA